MKRSAVPAIASRFWVLAGPLVAAFILQGCSHIDEEPVETDRIVIPGAWVFEPRVAQVESGTTVTWANNGGQGHTVTFENLDIDVVLNPGDTTQHTFEESGEYDYRCRYHLPDMVGTVIVVPVNETRSP